MPLAGERKRAWQRQYMRDLRAAEKAGRPLQRPKPIRPTVWGELAKLTARVAQLEAELAATRAAEGRCDGHV
jgi:hypothetical protein